MDKTTAHRARSKPTPTEVGRLIARRREAKGLTQVELSDRVDMSQEWASNIETGRIKRPRLDTLSRVADVLEIPLDELVLAAGYAHSESGASRVATEIVVDPESAEGRLVPLIRKIDWTDRDIEMMMFTLEGIARSRPKRDKDQ